ncbi:sorting nexin-24 isoform X6 [Macaca fascicularis]|uniref:sorting nexin-24 isoform X6 n=1 Tax=Macaca fascicularis TaxID=9541 RepID=UPI003D15C235
MRRVTWSGDTRAQRQSFEPGRCCSQATFHSWGLKRTISSALKEHRLLNWTEVYTYSSQFVVQLSTTCSPFLLLPYFSWIQPAVLQGV